MEPIELIVVDAAHNGCPYSASDLVKSENYLDELAKQEIERVCLSANSICNLGCKYCYFFNPANRIENNKRLSSEEIFSILENNQKYTESGIKKKIKVNFVGSGEPLLSWKEIKTALIKFNQNYPDHNLRFYMVTNGVLLTQEILDTMKGFNLTPSVSLDGPKFIHDANRIDKYGRGTFDRVIRGIKLLQNNGFAIIINTTMTYDLIENLEKYFKFVRELGVDKIIFDRLVDVPKIIPAVPYEEYYRKLDQVYIYWKENRIDLEIGNFTAYKRAINKNADRVCTMFGSTCGAGTNNIIYLQREVYPCGRMFGKDWWVLGDHNSEVKEIQNVMLQKYPKQRSECQKCNVLKECIKDCLMEELEPDYDCTARKQFLRKYKTIL